MTFDPTSVEVTCVTLPKDHFVQVPWEYINVCGYSDQFCKNYHIHTHTITTYTYYIHILHTHTTYRISDHIVSLWTTFRQNNKRYIPYHVMASSNKSSNKIQGMGSNVKLCRKMASILVFKVLFPVAASRGDMGAFVPPVGDSAPTCPPPVRRKNGQNQPFLAIFFLLLPPQKCILPPWCPQTKDFWCHHWLFTLYQQWKRYTLGPSYRKFIPVLVNTGTFLVYQYCLKMWYFCSLERASVIQKLTILECKNGLVLSNTCVPVSGTWSTLFPHQWTSCLRGSGTPNQNLASFVLLSQNYQHLYEK